MIPYLLASLTLIPAIPGTVRLAQALRARSRKWSRAIIVWGGLTMGTGVVVQAVNTIALFPAVARVPPEEKAKVLSDGLSRGGLAVPTGLVIGGLLCVLGGVTRSLFSDEAERA